VVVIAGAEARNERRVENKGDPVERLRTSALTHAAY
jgi:hypothetical protein